MHDMNVREYTQTNVEGVPAVDNNENRNNGKNETLEETTKAAIASKSETSEKNNESEGTNAINMLQSKMVLVNILGKMKLPMILTRPFLSGTKLKFS